MNEIKIKLAVHLQRPYNRSLDPLLDLCNVWRCSLNYISPKKRTQIISMPWASFRNIWGFNPRVGGIEVPGGTEDYIEAIDVIDVVANGK